jgi:hypothetical protein
MGATTIVRSSLFIEMRIQYLLSHNIAVLTLMAIKWRHVAMG